MNGAALSANKSVESGSSASVQSTNGSVGRTLQGKRRCEEINALLWDGIGDCRETLVGPRVRLADWTIERKAKRKLRRSAQLCGIILTQAVPDLGRRAMKRKKVSVLLDETDYAQFRDFCQERGYKKSTLISKLIRDFLASERDRADGARSKIEAKKSSSK